MLALKELCKAFPDHEHYIDWYSSAVIYCEYFIKQGSEISIPYYLAPNAVYRKSDILAIPDANRQQSGLRQYNEGYRLRRFVGDIYDNFSADIEYEGRIHVHAMAR